MGKIINMAAGTIAAVAVATSMMESNEPGSSVPVRNASIEGVHSGIEMVTLTLTDAATQVGPLTQTLAQQLGMSLQGVSSVIPAGQAPATQTQPTLPTPVRGQGLPDPSAK